MGASAWATGATDNVSKVQGAIAPNALPASSLAKGALFTQVATEPDPSVGTGSPAGSGIPGEAPERVYIDYDDSITLTNNSKLPQCKAGDGTLLGANGLLATLVADDTEGAIDDCDADDDSGVTVNRSQGAKTIIGSGDAIARTIVAAGPPPVIADLKFTVTAFNGPTSAAGTPCAGPGVGVGGPPGCNY